MNYALAQQLKDAGFPQRENPNVLTQGHYQDPEGSTFYSALNDRCVFVPTLSELIEACGDCLGHIKKWNGYWWAVSHCSHPEHEPGGNNLEEQGLTPDIAVAKLWIALNEKVV